AAVEAAGLPSASAAPAVDELRLAKLKKANLSSAGAWELGCVYMPEPVMGEDGRPFFPQLFLVVDHGSGQILAMELSERSKMGEAAATKFLALLEQTRRVPSQLAALKEQPLDFLQPIVGALGIPCFLAQSLPSLEEAQASVLGGMG
ncbi:DUF6930 domain-containing protein, partial [Paenibacillus sp. HJGM_3]|uniref:DUF6930 domain-containing protein n=1 Tax=Paenibacillus sp. HJGM_3 TaxID=3379816 RepID=UPI00385FDA79